MQARFFFLFFSVIFLLCAPYGFCARDQIRIIGSSTVLPYVQIVAERFGENFPSLKTPVVESGGSGAGIKEFCKGIGSDTVDIVNASRPIMASEIKLCHASGVQEIQEVKFGYDGMVFAANDDFPSLSLTPEDVYHALSAKIFMKGKFVDNSSAYWSDINPVFPKKKIMLYIPGTKHGTRNVLEDAMKQACYSSMRRFQLYESNNLSSEEPFCKAVRKDGKVIEIDGDNTETFARLISGGEGIGIFSLSFYQNNADRLQIMSIDGVFPSLETLSSKKYIFSRPLFFYVKKQHLARTAGLREYVDFFLDEQTIGPEGYLAQYGLAPLSEHERTAQRAAFLNAVGQ